MPILSPKSLRKRLGNTKEVTKASAKILVPKNRAKTISRTSPNTRLIPVTDPNEEAFFKIMEFFFILFLFIVNEKLAKSNETQNM